MFLQSLVLLFGYTTYYYYQKYEQLVKRYSLEKYSAILLMDDDEYEDEVYDYSPATLHWWFSLKQHSSGNVVLKKRDTRKNGV